MSAVFKTEAHRLVDDLPEGAGWEQLIYQAALHRAIEQGLAEADAGLGVPAEEFIRQLEQLQCA